MYCLVMVIWAVRQVLMYAARRVSDWRPLPPTPSSSELPPGWRSTREMRQTWPIASTKSTRFIGMFISLYSASELFIVSESLSMDSTVS